MTSEEPMKKIAYSAGIILVSIVITSCASLWNEGQTKEAASESSIISAPVTANSAIEQPETKPAVPKTGSVAERSAIELQQPRPDTGAVDDLGLAQARMNERLKDIENELRRQREVLKLLEQGLLTGIAPDALKLTADDPKPSELKSTPSPGAVVEPTVESSALLAPKLDTDVTGNVTPVSPPNTVSPTTTQEFETLLTLAKKRFQEGDFSAAIQDFARLSRQFGEGAGDGILRFWIGKCYFQLKEYSTSRTEFEAYLSSAPAGMYAAEARLELAKTLTKMGLKQRAQNELKRVIKEFEGQEPAEIAAHELRIMQGAL